MPVWVLQTAVVPHGVRLVAWRPHQAPCFAAAFCDLVDRFATAQSETQMAEVGSRHASGGPARNQDKNELPLFALFREPNNGPFPRWVSPAVNRHKLAQSRVEALARSDVPNVQRDVGQHGAHGDSLGHPRAGGKQGLSNAPAVATLRGGGSRPTKARATQSPSAEGLEGYDGAPPTGFCSLRTGADNSCDDPPTFSQREVRAIVDAAAP